MSKTQLIRQFQILIHQCSITGEKTATFRARQYSNAIKILQSYEGDFNIDNITQISEHFKTNGTKNPQKTIEKITDFIKLGYIPQAKEALENPQINSLIELTRIANIGPSKATELFKKYGISTIEQLRTQVETNPSIINDKQKLGLKYHDDLEKRIPKSEMKKYDVVIGKFCKNVSDSLQMSINGSYRRKCPDSGDIDVLVTGPKGKNKELRNKLIDLLITKGIIQEVLARGDKKFMGISRLSKTHPCRHIDIIDTDIDEYPFAQLYFTGSGGFNADMRAVALKKGYSMNEYCLSDKNTKVKISEETILQKLGKSRFECEKDIFQFLDMEYVLPENRNKTTLSKLK
uniref:DNA-directed DNA polymerase X domain-containing protein n=1 Tax=viral metagenome TaxID=1070528 RepID=A0A6C0JI14_9ZZZZ